VQSRDNAAGHWGQRPVDTPPRSPCSSSRDRTSRPHPALCGSLSCRSGQMLAIVVALAPRAIAKTLQRSMGFNRMLYCCTEKSLTTSDFLAQRRTATASVRFSRGIAFLRRCTGLHLGNAAIMRTPWTNPNGPVTQGAAARSSRRTMPESARSPVPTVMVSASRRDCVPPRAPAPMSPLGNGDCGRLFADPEPIPRCCSP